MFRAYGAKSVCDDHFYEGNKFPPYNMKRADGSYLSIPKG